MKNLALTLLILFQSINSFGASKGKVLIVLSSEDKITLKNQIEHSTGFFLTELMGPMKALVNAGYTPVFANPKGTLPVMDKVSDSPFWYGEIPSASEEAKAIARKEYQENRKLCEELGVCGKPGTNVGTVVARKLSEVRLEGLEEYVAVFFPGGHAPMEDLWKDNDVRAVLKYFHQSKRPTGLICHAPISLLATLDDPQGYINALVKDDRKSITEITKNWIYKDYKISVFTTREEQQEEPGADNALGGYMKFYPDAALERAGAFVTRADKWQSNAVRDRELITGQNPFSHSAMAELFIKAIAEK